MNIAFINRIFNPTYGGLERFQVGLVHKLIQKGINVTVFAEEWDDYSIKDIEIIPVKRSHEKFLPNAVKFARSVQKMIEHHKFDCIFANTPFYPCDIHRAGGGIHQYWYKFRADELGGLHKFEKYLPRYKAALNLEKKIYTNDNVSFQVANSRLVKAQMIEFYGYPEERIHVIHNGIDFNVFSKVWCKKNRVQLRRNMKIADSDFVILFPSNNFKRKGFSVLAEAVKQSRFNNQINILAVGRDKARYPGVRIRIEGHQDNILPYYAVSDCMILPTMYEPCSNVVLEAMACGILPVTSPTNGASEFISHGENGFILDSWDDVYNLRQIIEFLYSNRKTKDEISHNAADSVKGLTVDTNADKIFNLCLNVISYKRNDSANESSRQLSDLS